jgi:hypothetical protein
MTTDKIDKNANKTIIEIENEIKILKIIIGVLLVMAFILETIIVFNNYKVNKNKQIPIKTEIIKEENIKKNIVVINSSDEDEFAMELELKKISTARILKTLSTPISMENGKIIFIEHGKVIEQDVINLYYKIYDEQVTLVFKSDLLYAWDGIDTIKLYNYLFDIKEINKN